MEVIEAGSVVPVTAARSRALVVAPSKNSRRSPLSSSSSSVRTTRTTDRLNAGWMRNWQSSELRYLPEPSEKVPDGPVSTSVPEHPVESCQASLSSTSDSPVPPSTRSVPSDPTADAPHRGVGGLAIPTGCVHRTCPAAAAYTLKAHKSASFSPCAFTPPKM